MRAQLTAPDVKELGRRAGFDLIGIASADPLEESEQYRKWIERGFHGTMEYLARGADARRDPRLLLPEARAVIVCALSYLTPPPFRGHAADTDRPLVSRYAWGSDYHPVVRRRLRRLHRLLETHIGHKVRARVCVDTAPVLERALAARAGLGWIGENNCLIHPTFGSFLFIGELLIDVELTPSEPIADRCGRCERCRSACPTQALVGPRLLDARRCISYLTIEHRGPIDPELASRIGPRVYGCDACQEVCPWNQRARRRLATNVREFWPAPQVASAQFDDFVFGGDEEFGQFFTGSPIRRLGWDNWQRNLDIALKNTLATTKESE